MPERIAPPALSGTRGEFQRDTLRKANHPLNTHELAGMVMRERGSDPADRITFKLISQRTGNGLAKLRKAGKVCSKRVGSEALLEWILSAR